MSSRLKLNLGQAFDLFVLQEKLLNCEPTILGDLIRIKVSQHKTHEAVKFIRDQRAAGHEESLEMCLGASTLQLIDRLT